MFQYCEIRIDKSLYKISEDYYVSRQRSTNSDG